MTITLRAGAVSSGIQQNGVEFLTADVSNNVSLSNNLTVAGTLAATGAITGSSTVAGSTGILYPLTSGTAQTYPFSVPAAIDFTSIPSWVKRITVMLRNVSTNGASTPWLVQIGPSGGIETTGYQGTTSVVTTAVASYNITTGFGIQVDNSSTNVVEGSVTISLLDSATNTWVCSGSVAHSNRVYLVLMAYSKPIAGVLSRVRLTTTNGTDIFDAGSVNILYE